MPEDYAYELCPICRMLHLPEAIETHHILERKESKERGQRIDNRDGNLIDICGSCHNLVTAGKIITERKVLTTDGLKLMWRYSDDEEWFFS